MEFRVLRYFLAITREGSYTKAAQSLNVTQPTLSRQIKDLEAELGQPLFVRSAHAVTLTAAGYVLRKRAEEILDMVGKTKADFSNADDVLGDVYIGGGETQGMRLIAAVIADLHRDFPDIRFHLHSGNAEDITERLDKGLLDFGVLIQPTDLSKYASLSLPVKDVWGVLMNKNHPLAQKERVFSDDLTGIPLLCSKQLIQKRETDSLFTSLFGTNFEKMNIIATYNLLFNAALLAERNVGCVLCLDGLIDTMAVENIVFRPLSPTVESELDVVWKKGQIFPPAAALFLNRLRETVLFQQTICI